MFHVSLNENLIGTLCFCDRYFEKFHIQQHENIIACAPISQKKIVAWTSAFNKNIVAGTANYCVVVDRCTSNSCSCTTTLLQQVFHQEHRKINKYNHHIHRHMNQYTHRDGAQEIQISKSCFCSSTLCLTCSTRSTISRGMTSGLSSRPSRCCRRAPTSTPWNVIPESTTRPRPKSLGTEDHSGPGTIHDEAGHGFLLVFDTYRVYLILMFVLIESFCICLYMLVSCIECITLYLFELTERFEQNTNQIRTDYKPDTNRIQTNTNSLY